ncbi:hypothetical protein HBA54_04865 [Pelagibius litoralis]|uniref:Uncharacterized protein n=1 Tax=Pelagibius litoralis TaxID=374515 RepID=A0A967C7C0_9PROT|nr:hypothetical protein [Pelagibius litoralis]NIA67917.1 hypothetical protein [Pelagibius litoralis]
MAGQENALAELGQDTISQFDFEPTFIKENVADGERWESYRQFCALALASLRLGSDELTEAVKANPELFCGSMEGIANTREAMKATADLMDAAVARITIAIARSDADA